MLNLVGNRYGRLIVIKETDRRITRGGHSVRYWECMCDCGNLTVASSNQLRSGNTKSCGCLRKDCVIKTFTTHNQSKSKLYRIWYEMKGRCLNKKDKAYKNYGDRGITVCDEWINSFSDFSYWATNNGYEQGLTIERIDNDGNYCPENCKWVPRSEQSKNRRSCHFITYSGQKKTLSDWARYLGVKRSILRYYIDKFDDDIEGLEKVISMQRKKE